MILLFLSSKRVSDIIAINSELVGLPLVFEIVHPKYSDMVVASPQFQAISIACLIARSTLAGVVSNVFAIVGYKVFVTDE